ncbi:MAG: GTPase Era [Bacteroidota bacterium]
MTHRAGFVSIIGRPNVGKSTLMNRLIGENLSIVTHKAQTTRHRIKGILNGDDFQIVFSDTPGILEPHYLLHKRMMEFVQASLEDADAVLFITDLTEGYTDEELVKRIKAIQVPVIIVLNKVDVSIPDEINKLVHGWKKAVQPHAIIPCSALKEFNISEVRRTLLDIIPQSPPFFPKEEISDASLRFFASEFIREKIFLHYQEEIPYSTTVEIESFKEDGKLIRIGAVIYVERDSQKGIIIGKKGTSIKRIGTEARKDLESFLGRKVFLELFVKVEKDWRKSESKLKRFGYSQN